jgi:hypothetical protein
MRLWSASAFDQIDGGITLQRVAELIVISISGFFRQQR